MTDNEPRAGAIRRRDEGIRRLSSLTAALAMTSVVGSGVVVYAVAQHSSGTASGTPSSGTQPGSSTSGAGLQAPANAPGPPQSVPIVTSHGS